MGRKHISFHSTNQAMSHSDYCRLLHCTTHSFPALTEEKFMLKALMTAAVLATSMASASAYSDSSDQPPPMPAAKAATANKSTHMKLQAGTETVKVRAVYSPDIRPNPPQAFAADDGEDADASGWRSYGMLLATLVLMGVIAVRRYKAGRP
jgi:hypothetical protein